jgi:hypothetical protein
MTTKINNSDPVFKTDTGYAGDVEVVSAENYRTLQRESASLRAQLEEAQKDAARLDWLQKEAMEWRTGISFDYCRHVEEGHVTEKGFRFMRHHHLGERKNSLRAVIDMEMEGNK